MHGDGLATSWWPKAEVLGYMIYYVTIMSNINSQNLTLFFYQVVMLFSFMLTIFTKQFHHITVLPPSQKYLISGYVHVHS